MMHTQCVFHVECSYAVNTPPNTLGLAHSENYTPGTQANWLLLNLTTALVNWTVNATKLDNVTTRERYDCDYCMVPTVIFMATMMLMGTAGNTLVVVVFFCKKHRTTANMYMLTLGVLDLTACVLLHPYIIAKNLQGYQQDNVPLCKAFEYLIHVIMVVQGTVLLSVGVDRYYAVRKPLKFANAFRRTRNMITACVVFGINFSLPLLEFYGVHTTTLVVHSKEYYAELCDYSDAYQGSLSMTIFGGMELTVFTTCFIINSVLYIIIGKTVMKQRKRVNKIRLFDYDPPSSEFSCTAPVSESPGRKHGRRQSRSRTFSQPFVLKKHREVSSESLEAISNMNHSIVDIQQDSSASRYSGEESAGEETKRGNTRARAASVSVTFAKSTTSTRVMYNKAGRRRTWSADKMYKNSFKVYKHGSRQTYSLVQFSRSTSTEESEESVTLKTTETSSSSMNTTPRKSSVSKKNAETPTRRKRNSSTAGCFQLSDSLVVPQIKTKPIGPRGAKMLLIVMVVFISSWIPFWVIKIAGLFSPAFTKDGRHWMRALQQLCAHFIYFNNAVNPVLYTFIHARFRYDCNSFFRRLQRNMNTNTDL